MSQMKRLWEKLQEMGTILENEHSPTMHRDHWCLCYPPCGVFEKPEGEDECCLGCTNYLRFRELWESLKEDANLGTTIEEEYLGLEEDVRLADGGPDPISEYTTHLLFCENPDCPVCRDRKQTPQAKTHPALAPGRPIVGRDWKPKKTFVVDDGTDRVGDITLYEGHPLAGKPKEKASESPRER